jgi:hypothetical protein
MKRNGLEALVTPEEARTQIESGPELYGILLGAIGAGAVGGADISGISSNICKVPGTTFYRVARAVQSAGQSLTLDVGLADHMGVFVPLLA